MQNPVTTCRVNERKTSTSSVSLLFDSVLDSGYHAPNLNLNIQSTKTVTNCYLVHEPLENRTSCLVEKFFFFSSNRDVLFKKTSLLSLYVTKRNTLIAKTLL